MKLRSKYRTDVPNILKRGEIKEVGVNCPKTSFKPGYPYRIDLITCVFSILGSKILITEIIWVLWVQAIISSNYAWMKLIRLGSCCTVVHAV